MDDLGMFPEERRDAVVQDGLARSRAAASPFCAARISGM